MMLNAFSDRLCSSQSKNILCAAGLTNYIAEVSKLVDGRYRFWRLDRDKPILRFPGIFEPAQFVEDALNLIQLKGIKFDGIIGIGDFPDCLILPLLAHELGLRSSSFHSALICQNKWLSRVYQSLSVPEITPAFRYVDISRLNAFEELEHFLPIWIKPIKSYEGYLGRPVRSRHDYESALAAVRSDVLSLSSCLDRFMALDDQLQDHERLSSMGMLAEELMSGIECRLDGYMLNGQAVAMGVVDTVHTESQYGFHYPSRIPEHVQEKMLRFVERFFRYIEFDNSPFNVEFFYRPEDDSFFIIEIHNRVTQFFHDLYHKVDGKSSFEVALELSTGSNPTVMRRKGEFSKAACYYLFSMHDCIIDSVPSRRQISDMQRQLPDVVYRSYYLSMPGIKLSELPQSYDCYIYGSISVGGASEAELSARFHAARELLPVELSSVAS